MKQFLLLLLLVFAACRGDQGRPKASRQADAGAADAGALDANRSSGEAVESDSGPPMPDPRLPEAPGLPATPRGLPPLSDATAALLTPERVELGRLLFFDPRLSRGRRMSCSSCHVPELAWADAQPRSQNVDGKLNLRHTPTLLNVGYQSRWLWDGRAESLSLTIEGHWRGQLGITPAQVVATLSSIPGYRARFFRAFGRQPDARSALLSLSAFVVLIRDGDAPWDRYETSAVAGSVPPDVDAGAQIFFTRAGCGLCHAPPLYTDLRAHNRGVGVRPDGSMLDVGRYRVTKDRGDLGAFKTPTLRGLTMSAPYFHDGSARTLADAVDHELEQQRLEAPLSREERRQLLAFIRALSSAPRAVVRPTLPAEIEQGIPRPRKSDLGAGVDPDGGIWLPPNLGDPPAE